MLNTMNPKNKFQRFEENPNPNANLTSPNTIKRNMIISKFTHTRKIQKLIDILQKYSNISPVNEQQLSAGNTFTNPVIALQKGQTLKIDLDARYLNSIIDDSKCNWPIEPLDVALTIEAYNQLLLITNQ